MEPRRVFKPARNRRLDPAVYTKLGQTCFFTIRAAGTLAPFADPVRAQVVVDCLLGQQVKSGCRLDVYCVMPDHLHLLVTPVQEGASSLLYVDRFKGWCGRELRLRGWKGPLWQPRSYDHLVRKEEDLQALAAYILQNSVRKGMCAQPEDYSWGGIPGDHQPS